MTKTELLTLLDKVPNDAEISFTCVDESVGCVMFLDLKNCDHPIHFDDKDFCSCDAKDAMNVYVNLNIESKYDGLVKIDELRSKI